jgi:colanic acid biosynthesis glycosyl transferase WcaI
MPQPQRVLLLNQTFHPDVMATAQYLTDLALALRARGHSVTVVTSRRAYDQPDKIFAATEDWCGIRIHRIWSSRFGKLAKWRRAADFATFILCCCWRLLWLPRQDVTVALTSPPLISWIAAWFTRLRGGRFCYWVMDLNPDEAVAAGWLRAGSPVARVLESFSRFSLRTAARIVVLDRFMAERVRNKDIRAAKILVLSPWSQDEQVRFDALGREAFRREHGWDGKFVLMHAGNHSPCHPLDTVLAAAAELREEPGIVFCFQGGGSGLARVREFVAERKLTNVVCLPYQPVSRLAGALSAADAHVVVMGNEFVGTIHPCKIYNALAVGAPIVHVGPAESHVTDLLAGLPEPSRHVSVRHGDATGLVAELRRLARSQPKRATGAGDAAGYPTQAGQLARLVAVVEGEADCPVPRGQLEG